MQCLLVLTSEYCKVLHSLLRFLYQSLYQWIQNLIAKISRIADKQQPCVTPLLIIPSLDAPIILTKNNSYKLFLFTQRISS